MPWISQKQLQSLNAKIDSLQRDVAKLSERSNDTVASIEARLEPYFRYQNELAAGIATFAESESKIFTFSIMGCEVKFYLPKGGSDVIQRKIIQTSGFYQPKPLHFLRAEGLVRKNMKVLDVGANIGNHTIFFSKIMEAAEVNAFEPNPPAFNILRKNVELNGVADIVTLHQNGVGRAEGNAQNLPMQLNNLGGNRLLENPNGTVRIVRVDDVIAGEVDFMKIDVEGFGAAVIDGASALLEKHRPTILMEASSPEEWAAIEKLQRDLSYKFVRKMKNDVILSA